MWMFTYALLCSVILLAFDVCHGWIPANAFLSRVHSTSSLFSFKEGGDAEDAVVGDRNIQRLGSDDKNRLTDEELEAQLGDWDERVARFNTLHLVGRVGNNPEPRYFDDGNVVVNLSLACQRNYHYAERQANGIKSGEEETDWYGLEIWGQTAEFVSKYVDKGARIGVIGSLQIDQWADKETGEKRSRAKCIVRELDILETRAEAEARRSNQRGASFYTSSDTADDDDLYDPSRGSQGGFFD